MATATQEELSEPTVLHGLSYRDYARLVAVPANYHLRMFYLDGVLEIVSPKIAKHEVPSFLFLFLVTTVAGVLGLKTKTVGSGTFQRRGKNASLGAGAEPDQSFYIANYDRFPRDRDLNLDAGDPPPDLWIEVDNSVSSKHRYSIYASLGVPEVWCYRSRSKSLDFLRLVEGRYESVEWSLALPILSPPRVLEVFPLIEGLSDQDCILYLGDWARQLVEGRADGA